MVPPERQGRDDLRISISTLLHELDLGDDDSDKPNLTLDQLMTIAVVMSSSGRLTLCSINHWLCTNFKWYANEHKSCSTKSRTGQPGWYDYAQPCSCEIALACTLNNTTTEPTQLHGLLSPFRYHSHDRTVSVLPGWPERVLFPETIKAPEFHFYSRLPTEIRVEILRHAFTFNLDEDGWKIHGGLWRRSRPRTMAANVDGRGLTNIEQQALLSPLLVNKQMHRESAMLLFTQNNFHFDSCYAMAQFLLRIGPKNRSWMTSVSLDYMIPGNATSDKSRACCAFRLLSEAKRLHSLRLIMDETNITRYSKPMPARSFPGFRILRNFRGLRKVVFEGAYERAEAYLRDNLMTPFKHRTGERIKSKAQLEAAKVKKVERARKVWEQEIELSLLRREAKEILEQAEAWEYLEPGKEQSRRRGSPKWKESDTETTTSDEDDGSTSMSFTSSSDDE